MVVTVTAKHEKFVDLSLGRRRYLEAGNGVPLLMLHGMGITNSADTFEPIFEGLSEQFHVYALDMLGWGKGVRTIPEGPTFDLIVDDIREFMDKLGIAQAHLAGHSAGAWMAAHLAYQSPGRVIRLILMNGAGLNGTPSPRVGALAQPPTLDELKEGVRQAFTGASKAPAALVETQSQAQFDALSQPGALHSLDTLLHQMLTPEIRARYMLQRRIGKISVPALVFWGAGDVMDPYPTWTQEFEALKGDMSKSSKPWVIPGAKYVLLPTGHYSHWEMPDHTLKLITDFLKAAPAAGAIGGSGDASPVP